MSEEDISCLRLSRSSVRDIAFRISSSMIMNGIQAKFTSWKDDTGVEWFKCNVRQCPSSNVAFKGKKKLDNHRWTVHCLPPLPNRRRGPKPKREAPTSSTYIIRNKKCSLERSLNVEARYKAARAVHLHRCKKRALAEWKLSHGNESVEGRQNFINKRVELLMEIWESKCASRLALLTERVEKKKVSGGSSIQQHARLLHGGENGSLSHGGSNATADSRPKKAVLTV